MVACIRDKFCHFRKYSGKLQDAGNTTTLAHYLDLLSGAGMLCGLQKYAGQKVRQRGSSPKFQALNTALISAQSSVDFSTAKADREMWGRLSESCVGAHLVNKTKGTGIEVFYWSAADHEVDFVLTRKDKIIAIEVKSGAKKQKLPGMELFSREFKVNRKYLAGTGGISFDEFLKTNPEDLF